MAIPTVQIGDLKITDVAALVIQLGCRGRLSIPRLAPQHRKGRLEAGGVSDGEFLRGAARLAYAASLAELRRHMPGGDYQLGGTESA